MSVIGQSRGARVTCEQQIVPIGPKARSYVTSDVVIKIETSQLQLRLVE
jgi:hypothetical protein